MAGETAPLGAASTRPLIGAISSHPLNGWYCDYFSLRLRYTALAMAFIAALLMPLSVAQAGLLDRVKDIYQLPEQVEDIQNKYNETKQQLSEQQDRLTESIRQAQEREEQLLSQNRKLQEQNAALQQRLQTMEETQQAKDARTRKIIYTSITAAVLIAGYFVLGRLFRIAVWRREKGKLWFK